MKITVIGAGYVGLTVSGCMAALGHNVTCVEKDVERLEMLRSGRVPFYEPGLEDVLAEGRQRRNLVLTDKSEPEIASADVVFIAVGTPLGQDGEPDLAALREAAGALAAAREDAVIVIKSTVPVGTTDALEGFLSARQCKTPVAYNPEFLSEGSAIENFFHPYRLIIGTRYERAAAVLRSLYGKMDCPIVVTDPVTAEMIKYASNAFLAAKVSFVNEIAAVCERVGADIGTVATGMGYDPRIGPYFLRAGIGFGGSCLPKDLRALIALARRNEATAHMLEATYEVNEEQRARFVEKVAAALDGVEGKVIAVLGLAFKQGTSDVRESPAVDIVRRLLARGAAVRAFDPAAEQEASRALPALLCAPDPYETSIGADAILILTDWPAFGDLDWARLREYMRKPLLIDGRGIPGAAAAATHGFTYVGPGNSVEKMPHERSKVAIGF